MVSVAERKEYILTRLGEQGLKALKDFGINVDSAITQILQKQAIHQIGLEVKAESGDVNNMITSELVYKSASPEDAYGQEFKRRLQGICFTDEQISSLYQIEQIILSVDENLSEHRKQPWVRRYFIMPNSTPQTIPEKEFLTLSELVLISDDANSAFWRDCDALPNQAWAALCIAACCAPYTEGKYANHFNERTQKFGWSKAQNYAYVRNECLLTERLKWGMHEKPAWIPETCDLKQYQR